MSHRTRPVWLISLATAVSLLGDLSLYALLPTCYANLGLVYYQVGLILSVNRWVRLVTNHLAVLMVRRAGPGRMLTCALIIGAGMTALYGLAPPLAIILVGRAVWGLCWSLIRQVGAMMAVSASDGDDLGRMVGLYEGVSRVGAAAGAFLGGLAYDLLGLGPGMFVLATASLASVPLGLAAVRRDGAGGRAARPSAKLALRGAGWALPLFAGLHSTAISLIVAVLGLIIATEMGQSLRIGGLVIGIATVNGALVGAQWLSDTVGAPTLGALGDAVGWRRLAIGLCTVGVAALVGAWYLAGAAIVPGILVFYLARTGLMVVTGAEAGSRGPRAYASYVTADDAGAAVGPLAGWLLQGLLPSAHDALLLGAGLAAVALAVAPRALRGRTGRHGGREGATHPRTPAGPLRGG